MQLQLDQLSGRDRYKLLASTVLPRPIALVSSLDEQGRVNAAPFSFFNVMGSDPPLLALGIGNRGPAPKDTAHNIRANGHYVVNLVSRDMAEQMNACAADYPPEVNELEQAGLTPVALGEGLPPRIEQSPISYLCREHSTLHIGRNRLILGIALQLYAHEHIIDIEQMHIAAEKLHLVGRMHAPSFYTTTDDLFEMQRPQV